MRDDNFQILSASHMLTPNRQCLIVCHLQFVIQDELGVTSLNQRMSLKEILDGLPNLTDEERVRLQEELDAFSPDHERAWAKIAEERLRSIRAGEKQAISSEDVFAKARHSIGE
jgi:hypothetical protein